MRNSISSARERRVGNDFRGPNFARGRDRDSDRAAARSDARSAPADSCCSAAFTDLVRSTVRSKLPFRVRDAEQPIRALSGARDRDRNCGRSGRRLRTPGTPMSSRSLQLHGSVRKLSLA